jgi:hypothetical protein
LPSGHLVVETACRRCGDGWNRRFKLRVPGDAVAAPLVAESRVFFGAGDNIVYCVRRSNGHRVWNHDAGGRIASPLVLWTGTPRGFDAAAEPVALVLAVPDQPAIVLALDARTGERAATYDAGIDRVIVGAPLVLADGRIAIARQGYRPADASLVLLEVGARGATPTEDGSGEQEQDVAGPDVGAVGDADLEHLRLVGEPGAGVGQRMERLHDLDDP